MFMFYELAGFSGKLPRAVLMHCKKYKKYVNQIAKRKLTDFCSCFDSICHMYVTFYPVLTCKVI